jgi:hypothetical protein
MLLSFNLSAFNGNCFQQLRGALVKGIAYCLLEYLLSFEEVAGSAEPFRLFKGLPVGPFPLQTTLLGPDYLEQSRSLAIRRAIANQLLQEFHGSLIVL